MEPVSYTHLDVYKRQPQSGVLSSNLSAIGLAFRTDIRLEMDIRQTRKLGGNFFLDLLGPTGFRFWLGVIIVIAIVASAYLYFRVK